MHHRRQERAELAPLPEAGGGAADGGGKRLLVVEAGLSPMAAMAAAAWPFPLGEERDRLLVEGGKGLAAQPLASLRDDAVGEVSPSFQQRKPRLRAGPHRILRRGAIERRRGELLIAASTPLPLSPKLSRRRRARTPLLATPERKIRSPDPLHSARSLKCFRPAVLGINHHRAHPDNLRSALNRVAQKASADSLPLPFLIHGESRKKHDRDWITG